jgi:hypothetical protein
MADERILLRLCWRDDLATAPIQSVSATFTYEGLGASVARFGQLAPDTAYSYRVTRPDGQPVDLEGLAPADLHFRTLPAHGYDEQLDFLLMSCHNPETARGDGCDGFAVWSAMPDIIVQNANVQFALLIGDPVYGDDIEKDALQDADLRSQQERYLAVYDADRIRDALVDRDIAR